MKRKWLLLVSTFALPLLASCGEEGNFSTSSGGQNGSSNEVNSSQTDSSEEKKEFTGVTFENLSFMYDGKPHILNEVVGAPENTTITYSGRTEKIDVGSYEASAKLEKNGYKEKVLRATLSITPAIFSGYTYESKSVKYDGSEHINDIQLVGVLPEGTTLKETVKNANGDVVSSAIDVGLYDYTCLISNKNYVTLTLKATLQIKPERTNMPVFISKDGTIYFNNGLDNSYLYSLTGSTLKLIDYSSVKEFNKYSPSSALFIADSIFLDSVKQVKDGSTDILFTDGDIDDFVKLNENVYFYSNNTLTAKKSGIYKVDATDKENEPLVTKVFEGKTDNLAIYNDNLFFTNGNDHKYLYKMDLSTNACSLLMNEKVHEFTISNGRLYCTVNGTINDYIGYLDLNNSSTKPTKLTNAAGEFLTVKDGYLYYNYTDLFSAIDDSTKGIWRISINGGRAEQLLANNGVNGFDVESSNSLVYVDSMDLHLYRLNISTKVKTDLLKGFVAPEITPLNLGGKTISFGNKIYYLNMYAGKTLYYYDETLKKNYQLTTNKVVDFYIYEGIMYFNQVTLFTNNDLYSVNLLMGGEASKLNSNDVRNMVSDGTYIYATHYNWAGVSGGLSRMKLDGSEYIKFSEVNGAKNLAIREGKLYFINCSTASDNGNIEYISLKKITKDQQKLAGVNLSKNIKKVKQFLFEDNNIFYSYDGTIDNSVRRTDFTSLGEGIKLASNNTNPNEFVLYGNYIYYYSYAVSVPDKAGFYKVKKDASGDGTQELLVGYASKYFGSSLSISEKGDLYFLNFIPKLLKGDAHFYQIDLSSNNVSKIN